VYKAQKQQQSLCAAALEKPKCLQKSLQKSCVFLYHYSHVTVLFINSSSGCKRVYKILKVSLRVNGVLSTFKRRRR